MLSFMWLLAGLILCITIVGNPFGVQCFKFAFLILTPFGKEVVYSVSTGSFLMNVLWLIFFGWELALASLGIGLLWCITIVGLPIGIQCIKFAKLSFMPFGAEIK